MRRGTIIFLIFGSFMILHGQLLFAQTGVGFVGIYTDSLGTQPCATVPPFSSANLYVVGKLDGATSTGITGAEFRIEVTDPDGWFFSYVAPTSASLAMGNPIDTNTSQPSNGLSLAFPECKTGTNGSVVLGTISVFNLSGSQSALLVKRHSNPTNVGLQCPLFTLCDASFASLCMTPSTSPPCSLSVSKALLGITDDPTVFVGSINSGEGQAGSGQSDPSRQVLVMFAPGIIQLPSGGVGATVQASTINSIDVANVLEANGVEFISKSFPDFTSANTVGTARTGEEVRLTDFTELYTLRLPSGQNLEAFAAALSAFPGDVVYAEPDAMPQSNTCTYTGLCAATIACPSDDRFDEQWSLYNAAQTGGTCDADINAFEAWSLTEGSASTKIGIIDSGVDAAHEDLLGKVSGDAGFGGTATFIAEHGTHVAGIAAANSDNGIGITGVDFHARIISKRIAGLGTAEIVNKVRDAVQTLGVQVLNNSWTIPYSTTLRLGFRDVYVLNALSVTAMGNGDGAVTRFPAGLPNQLAVGSTDRNDNVAANSNTGNHIDVAAPGVNILSTLPASLFPQRYGLLSGTSMATPHVAGLAGLLLAYGNFVGKTLYNDDLEQIIRVSAKDLSPTGWDAVSGTGRINAEAALQRLQFPYELTQASVTGGSSIGNTDWQNQIFMFPLNGDAQGTQYRVRRYEIHKAVTFPIPFQSAPDVWGRGVATVGWNDDNPNYAEGLCEVVPGTVTPVGCTLRTFVYEVRNLFPGTLLGWWPANINNVVLAYTALGQVTATDIGDGENTESQTRVSFSSPNPLSPGSALMLSLPMESMVRVDLFNAMGRRVRVVHQGRLPAGRHMLSWDGVDSQNRKLASGVYFAKLQTDAGIIRRKVAILR